ncbi:MULTISPECIES: alpha/beta hydrolase [Rhizobium]|uniref:Abhydrolase domain-containing protein 12B n=1 Tax=Rhizobium favelukesii TaxID=348824 RepID=W6R9E6_9HYPH|nr:MULTISPECIES: alpha/beta fold hydrolase [Rhizobium]MCS0458154.1 alpha/beta hydrolase [Rhizobium favelukesii]UFS80665.1 alpha/beta hydrolase [Rhizobium sp. T136]CDM57892.1 Abhydrolase domain-containing protein 12B [Rhizobium favelukesii]
MTNFALKVTRLGFSLLQSVSPRIAGKAAFRLFCVTPSTKPKGEKAKAAHAAGAEKLAGAERFTLRLTGGGRAHAYRLNGGALGRRPRYLVTHGWGSSGAYMGDLAETLAATGAEVIAVDFPGHGRAAGRVLHMGMAVKAIAAAERRFGAFDAAIGHSFGGAALMVAAAGMLPGVTAVLPEKLALIGSPSEMHWLFKDFGKMIGLGRSAQQVLETEVFRVTGRRLEEFDASRAADAIRRPVLIVHAEDDKEVNANHARRYAAASDHVRLYWANGFGHRRIVGARPVLDAITGFLAEGDADKAAEIIPLFDLPARRMSL